MCATFTATRHLGSYTVLEAWHYEIRLFVCKNVVLLIRALDRVIVFFFRRVFAKVFLMMESADVRGRFNVTVYDTCCVERGARVVNWIDVKVFPLVS